MKLVTLFILYIGHNDYSSMLWQYYGTVMVSDYFNIYYGAEVSTSKKIPWYSICPKKHDSTVMLSL